MLCVAVMVGALLALTLHPLNGWVVAGAVLAVALGFLAFMRFWAGGQRTVLGALGMAFLVLAFAVPFAGLGGALAGAGVVLMVTVWAWQPLEREVRAALRQPSERGNI